jgi:hypothetical protein
MQHKHTITYKRDGITYSLWQGIALAITEPKNVFENKRSF